MAKHVWAVLCKRVIVDDTSHNASLIDTIDEITIETDKPLVIEKWQPLPMEAALVVLSARSDRGVPETSRLRMDLFGPEGELFEYHQETIAEIDLQNSQRARTTLNLKTIPIRGNGPHKFVILLEDRSAEWKQVAEIPLDVKIIQSPSSDDIAKPTSSGVVHKGGRKAAKKRPR